MSKLKKWFTSLIRPNSLLHFYSCWYMIQNSTIRGYTKANTNKSTHIYRLTSFTGTSC